MTPSVDVVVCPGLADNMPGAYTRPTEDEDTKMAIINWSQCEAVESVPGKRSGAMVFRDTRTPVSVVFDNLETGATIEEIMDWFHLSHAQVTAVIEFAARSLDAPSAAPLTDAHPV